MKPATRNAAIAFAVFSFLLTAAAAAQDWEIDWHSIDAGGELNASGEQWELSGTGGQWDASPVAATGGGPWEISAGFWSQTAAETDRLFADGFEN